MSSSVLCPWCRGDLSVYLPLPPPGWTYGMDMGRVAQSPGLLVCKCCDRRGYRWEDPCTHRPKVVR